MTADLMGAAPEGSDPLAPEHVAPLVTYLAGPGGACINGEVFVVHGGVAAVMDPPRVREVFRAGDGDMWTLDSVRSEEHTSELQSRENLVCRLLLEKKKKKN